MKSIHKTCIKKTFKLTEINSITAITLKAVNFITKLKVIGKVKDKVAGAVKRIHRFTM